MRRASWVEGFSKQLLGLSALFLTFVGSCGPTAGPIVTPAASHPAETLAIGAPAEVLVLRDPWLLSSETISAAGQRCNGKHVTCSAPATCVCDVWLTQHGLIVSRDEDEGIRFSRRTIGKTTNKWLKFARLWEGQLTFVTETDVWVAKPPTAIPTRIGPSPGTPIRVTSGKDAILLLDGIGQVHRSVDSGATWRVVKVPSVRSSVTTSDSYLRPLTTSVNDVGLDGKGHGLLVEVPSRMWKTMDDGESFTPLALPTVTPRYLDSRAEGIVAGNQFFVDGGWSPIPTLRPEPEIPDKLEPELAGVSDFAAVGAQLLLLYGPPTDGTVAEGALRTYYSQLRQPHGVSLPKREEKELSSCKSIRVSTVEAVGRYADEENSEVTVLCEDKDDPKSFRLYSAEAHASGLSEFRLRMSFTLNAAKPWFVSRVLSAGDGLWFTDMGEGKLAWSKLDETGRHDLNVPHTPLDRVIRTREGIWLLGRTNGSNKLVVGHTNPNGNDLVVVDSDEILLGPMTARARGETLEVFGSTRKIRATYAPGDKTPRDKITLREDTKPVHETVAFAGHHVIATDPRHRTLFESSDDGMTFRSAGDLVGWPTRCSLGGCVGTNGPYEGDGYARLGWDNPTSKAIEPVPSTPDKPKPPVLAGRSLTCTAVGKKTTFAGYPVSPPSLVSNCGKSPFFSAKSALRLVAPLGRYTSAADATSVPVVGMLQHVEHGLDVKFESFLGPIGSKVADNSPTLVWANSQMIAGIRYSFEFDAAGDIDATMNLETITLVSGQRLKARDHFKATSIPHMLGVHTMHDGGHHLEPTTRGFALMSPLRPGKLGIYDGKLTWRSYNNLFQEPMKTGFSTPLSVSSTYQSSTLVVARLTPTKSPDEERVEPLSVTRFAPDTSFVMPDDKSVVSFPTVPPCYPRVARCRIPEFAEIGLFEINSKGEVLRKPLVIPAELPACGRCAAELKNMTIPAQPIAVTAFGHSTVDPERSEMLLGLEGDTVCSLGRKSVGSHTGANLRRLVYVNTEGKGLMIEMQAEGIHALPPAHVGPVRANLTMVALLCTEGIAKPFGPTTAAAPAERIDAITYRDEYGWWGRDVERMSPY